MGLLARFAPNLVPGLGALLNPYVLIGAAALAIACFLAGAKFESDHRDALLLKAQQQAEKQYAEGVERQKRLLTDTAARLAQSERARAGERRLFREDLRNARNRLVQSCTPASSDSQAAAPADVRLSAEFVRLWNRAWAGENRAADRPATADGGTGPAGVAQPGGSNTGASAGQREGKR